MIVNGQVHHNYHWLSFLSQFLDEVTECVRLKALQELTDIQMFKIHCSCIPINVFQAIVINVMDMDKMLIQYGTFSQNKTKEAKLRFFALVRMLTLSWS